MLNGDRVSSVFAVGEIIWLDRDTFMEEIERLGWFEDVSGDCRALLKFGGAIVFIERNRGDCPQSCEFWVVANLVWEGAIRAIDEGKIGN